MKFRINMNSAPGSWKYCKGYVDVDAPTIHQAFSRAMKRLYTGAFPNWPKGSLVIDDVLVKRLEFEAEEYRSR